MCIGTEVHHFFSLTTVGDKRKFHHRNLGSNQEWCGLASHRSGSAGSALAPLSSSDMDRFLVASGKRPATADIERDRSRVRWDVSSAASSSDASSSLPSAAPVGP